MSQLRTKRLRFSRDADNWLRVMKSRTGITPNLLCRLGFCASLEEGGRPDPGKYPEDSDREINRYTLLGEFENVLVALLRQRLVRDGVDLSEMDDMFRAHMNRGVILLAGRLKGLDDLHGLAVGAQRAAR
ncbi:MAG: DNA sulfur modification protein DndE [Sorangiineae bacterium PRO1]|nr:DNA sulfur modification protein DndE [Sorangiineae bacterium PRO1]